MALRRRFAFWLALFCLAALWPFPAVRGEEASVRRERALLVGVDDDKFDGAMKVIEHVCKSRKQIATSPSPIAGTSGVYVPYPVEVMVGGATIFVLNVEQFVKI